MTLGGDIVARQETAAWGDGLIPRFAKDLKAAFPHLTGFSERNLIFASEFIGREHPANQQQLAAQLEGGNHSTSC
ncbi:MAG: DUF1016 N-terminal domain-containing protein [Rheinheimera sp.]|nr:DUF1016 N-terminal domain-containing protein [Rheinheimera sp.]